MSNKSSIEWLMFQLYEQGLLKGDGNKMDELLEQAKAMHKEEIVNTWSEATSLDHEIGLLDASYILCQIHNAEQYYTETFGK